MLNQERVPLIIKIITYILIYKFLYFQITYIKAFDTATCLLSNYSLIKKLSNSSNYNGKIIFVSSGKQIYQNYLDQYFYISFNTIFIKKVVRYCVVRDNKREDGSHDLTHEWVQYQDFSNYYEFRQNPLFSSYEKYFDFQIGNYIVNASSFNIIKTDRYVLSTDDIDSFSKSPASSKLTYLGDGYFFDSNFPDHRDLYTRLHNCRNSDSYIIFEVYNPLKVSIFGLLNNGIISHADFLKYDFSVIYDGKIAPNQFIADSISKERTKTIVTGILIIIILIIIFIYYNQPLFSIFIISFLILASIQIRAYYFSNFPIRFKYMLFYSICGIVFILFLFGRDFLYLLNILLLS